MTRVLALLLVGCSTSSPDDAGPSGPPPADPGPTQDTAPSGTATDTAAHDTGPVSTAIDCGALLSVEQIGGADHESLAAVEATSDGATYLAGSFLGSLPLGAGSPNATTFTALGTDVFLARYEPDGTYAWARQVAAPLGATAGSVADTADGGAVFTGTYFGSATFAAGEPDAVELLADTVSEAFVARFDASGGLTWVTRFGETGAVRVQGVVTLADGAVLAVGNYYADATFGPGEPGETVLPLHPTATESGFVARLESDGQLAWATSFGGAEFSRGTAVGLDPVTGDLIVAGEIVGPGTTSFPGAGPVDTAGSEGPGFLSRWDAGGDATSIVTFPGYPNALDVGADGSVAVVGEFAETAVFGRGEPNETVLTTQAFAEVFIAHYAPDHTLDWATQTHAATESISLGTGVASTPDGGAVAVGYFLYGVVLGRGEPNEVAISSQGSYDTFLARFDSGGALDCAVNLGGADPDIGFDLVGRPDGTFTTAGHLFSDLTLAPGTPYELALQSAGMADGFMATWAF